jgi:hypothetical protein
MDGRIDPSSTLGQQHIPLARRDGMRDGVGCEFHLERGEILHHERRQVSIFSERKEVLLVKRVDVGLGVFFDNHGGDDDRAPLVGGPNSVDGETTGQTGDRAEKRFKRLGEVVRDVVFVDLKMSDGLTFVLTWIIVVSDSRSFSSLVSPQMPIILESSDAQEIIRFSESGMTV